MPYDKREKFLTYQREYNYRRRERQRAYHRKRREDPEYREELKEVSRKRNKTHRQFLHEIKLHYGCSNPICFGPHLPDRLHFHHVEKAAKVFAIAGSASLSIEKLIAEINKTMVLCDCCHELHHSNKGLNLTGFRRCNLDPDGKPI
jgi:hypothetical protein